jgi:hypothetical protein
MKASGYKSQASGGVKDGVVLQGKRRRRSFFGIAMVVLNEKLKPE